MKSPRRFLSNSLKTMTRWQMLPIYYRVAGKFKPLQVNVPEQKEKAVVISFDVETFSRTGDSIDDVPVEYSDFLPRLLELLKSHSTRAHFFVSGRVIELFPTSIKPVVEGRHGLGGHGYMHENMTTLHYAQQMRVIETFSNVCNRLLNTRVYTWRSPYATSNFDTYRALRENGFKLSSSTAVTTLPLQIRGVLEIPYVMMDGDIVGYTNPAHWSKWIDVMKMAVDDATNPIAVLGMHPWLHMIYDPKLEGMESFLDWLDRRRESVWVGSMDAFLKIINASVFEF